MVLHTSLLVSAALLGIALPQPTIAQSAEPNVASAESVTVAAGPHYDAGAFKRFLLGNTYRDYWGKPVRVPVLDLRTYAGGLQPLKEGGGMQTKTLRLGAPGGSEFVLRLVKKTANPPDRLRGTLVEALYRDQLSAMYPAAAIVAAPVVAAAGVLHPTPEFVVMPNDSLLGKYRETFIDHLAMLEEYPTKPDEAPGFAGAVDIIDSEQLIPLLDSLPTHRVDDRAFLRARLTDFIIGDVDRHLGNWKWARFGRDDAVRWVPIARDRDHAFHRYDGLLARLASRAAPNLTTFDATYPGIVSLSRNARTLDRRLLVGLEKPTWDSIATALEHRITNAVIDSAVSRTPSEFRSLAPSFAAKLRRRRDGLRDVANRFYQELAGMVDIHATDAADVATITYRDGGFVDVDLQSGATRYLRRRFDPRETREVRVYLHDGDDAAIIRGDVRSAIVMRVVGGNGANTLIDSTAHRLTRLYDRGNVRGVSYGPDSLRDTLLNRRPWVNDTGSFRPPSPDFASDFKPTAGFGGGSGLGIVSQLGVSWIRYGFEREPYALLIGLKAEYSIGVDGYRVTLFGDRRLERSPLHYTATARMSDLEVINFHGLGNDTEREPDDFFHVRQRQWTFQPAVALALGRRKSDVTFGPVVQYSATDSTADRFIARERPYGFGAFGQAGVRLGFRYDTRNNASYATRGFLVDANSSAFPAVWDVEHTFSQVSGSATAFVGLPIPTHPVLAFRGGGRKVWGDAPFHELAFIGGRGTVRGMDAQRYAGDASLYGTSELRVPVVSVRYVIPLDIGLLGFVDAGRVYVSGESAGGWHTVGGGGIWFGILDQATGFSVTFTSSAEKRVLLGTGLRF
jgi:hypothetical protein